MKQNCIFVVFRLFFSVTSNKEKNKREKIVARTFFWTGVFFSHLHQQKKEKKKRKEWDSKMIKLNKWKT